jgi:hydroxymethylglutaryl-CoA lyase
MGCPYEGDVNPDKVRMVAQKLFDMGCYEVSLGDTIGAGTPEKTHKLMNALKEFPREKLAVHFHDTFG